LKSSDAKHGTGIAIENVRVSPVADPHVERSEGTKVVDRYRVWLTTGFLQLAEIISWTHDGSGVLIHDADQLERMALSQYFRVRAHL
jgi:hypothetical protein